MTPATLKHSAAAAILSLTLLSATLVAAQPAPPAAVTPQSGTSQSQPPAALQTNASPAAANTQSPTSANTCPAPCLVWKAPETWFIYTVLIILFVGILLSIKAIAAALQNSSWSLSDALSEESEVTENASPITHAAPPANPPVGTQGAASPVQGAPTNPDISAKTPSPLVTKLTASSSRLIALLGSIVILFLFLGFGIIAIYGFAATGVLPESIKQVVDYLLAGLTLFAPYTVNKFSKLFEGMTPKKT